MTVLHDMLRIPQCNNQDYVTKMCNDLIYMVQKCVNNLFFMPKKCVKITKNML